MRASDKSARSAIASASGAWRRAESEAPPSATSVSANASADPKRYLPVAAAVQKLLSPAEMGELFKVLAVGKGVPNSLMGFSRGDRSNAL